MSLTIDEVTLEFNFEGTKRLVHIPYDDMRLLPRGVTILEGYYEVSEIHGIRVKIQRIPVLLDWQDPHVVCITSNTTSKDITAITIKVLNDGQSKNLCCECSISELRDFLLMDDATMPVYYFRQVHGTGIRKLPKNIRMKAQLAKESQTFQLT